MNPYEVLGLIDGASAEEINKAYKDLMAFYSTADGDYSAKIDEINAAYDSLMYGANTPGVSNSYGSNKFGDVRAKIRENRFEDAETILDGVPISSRDAEWYYLKGLIFKHRGWLEDASDSFNKAVQLDPENAEYISAAESVKSKREGDFREDWRQNTEEGSGCLGSTCKICSALACCDCLCSMCR